MRSGQLWIFIRLVLSEWASRVTGSLSAILVIVGLGVSLAGAFGAKIPADSIVQLATWLLAAACGGQAAYAVWAKEREARSAAEDRLSIHAYGLYFEFAISLDRNNSENMVEIRMLIHNKSDLTLSWYLRSFSVQISEENIVNDLDKGPYILHRGAHTTWFPNRGLSRMQYESLQHQTIGSLHYEVAYGIPGQQHNRISSGEITLWIFKNLENGEMQLNWTIVNQKDYPLAS